MKQKLESLEQRAFVKQVEITLKNSFRKTGLVKELLVLCEIR